MKSYRVRIDGWDFFSEIEVPFLSFEDYVNSVDNMINKEILKAKEKYSEYQNIDEEVRGFLQDPWDEIMLRQKKGLEVIYYDSMIITIYSFVEKKMNFLCRHLQTDKKIKLRDFSDKGVRKYKNYLEKVLDFDFSKIDNSWSKLLKYGVLRNFLTHAENARLISKDTEGKEAIIAFLSMSEGVKISQQNDDTLFEFENNSILKNLITISQEILAELFLIEHILSDKDEKQLGDKLFE